MRQYGLIGKKLSHSFSKNFFTEKFTKEGLSDCQYGLFELSEIEEVTKLISNPDLRGFNITIPYKQAIMPYLDQLDRSADKVGAVNVVKVEHDKLIGYNSDYFGFKQSLEEWLPEDYNLKALVLGTGGASKAIMASLKDLNIDFKSVSRKAKGDILSYDQLTPHYLREYKLIVNTTPLGMSPSTDTAPDIDYNSLGAEHYLYDLVYNPELTKFLSLGKAKGSKIKNGLEMLHLQAEKSWEIWNS